MMSPPSIELAEDGARCTARQRGEVQWTFDVPGDDASNPFFEAVYWPAAEVVAIGRGQAVHFVDATTGEPRGVLALEPHLDYFGEFGDLDDDPDILYVLGWRHAYAFEASLDLRWRTREIAVDGIVWRGRSSERVRLSCEMDPPGGWRDVTLDRATGREVPGDDVKDRR